MILINNINYFIRKIIITNTIPVLIKLNSKSKTLNSKSAFIYFKKKQKMVRKRCEKGLKGCKKRAKSCIKEAKWGQKRRVGKLVSDHPASILIWKNLSDLAPATFFSILLVYLNFVIVLAQINITRLTKLYVY